LLARPRARFDLEHSMFADVSVSRAHRKLYAALLCALAASACADSEDAGGELSPSRARVLNLTPAAIAADALRDAPSADFIDARTRVEQRIPAATRGRARSFTLGPGRARALRDDAPLRAGRTLAAVALGTRIDILRENDLESTQNTLDTLLGALQAVKSGATSCDALGGTKADSCAVAVFILEVLRAEERAGSSLIDAGGSSTNVDPSTAKPVTPGDASVAIKPGTGIDAAVSTCVDEFERNDSVATATKLAFDATNKVEFSAKASTDRDYYEVTTVRADPVLVTTSFRTDPDRSWLNMAARNQSGSTDWIKGPGAEVTSASIVGWLAARAPGTVSYLEFEKIVGRCIPYTVQIDRDACTDAFEDNDSSAAAKPIATEQDHAANILTGDPDYYDISASVSKKGSCTVTHSVPTAGANGVALSIYGPTGSILAAGNPAKSASDPLLRTTVAVWNNLEVARVKVESQDSNGYCQPYTIRCTSQ